MPVYEYLCGECRPFTDMRPMAECDMPSDCPACHASAPRVILAAPHFSTMPAAKRQAHATNERSAHAPRSLSSLKSSHGAGCALLFRETIPHGQARQRRLQEFLRQPTLDDLALTADEELQPSRAASTIVHSPTASASPWVAWTADEVQRSANEARRLIAAGATVEAMSSA